MSHLVAYQQSVDQAVQAAINVVNDDILTRTSATRFLVPPDHNFIWWAAALGPNITRASLVAPSVGVRRTTLEIVPRKRGSNAFTVTSPEIWVPYRPFALSPTEELELQTAEDAAGASQMTALVCFGPQAKAAPPDGDVRVVRATGATTLGAFGWTTVTVTPDQTLEPGTYQLVGFMPISAGIIAARALITGQQYRPGMPGLAAAEAVAVDFDAALLNTLMYYPMGQFTHITMPQFQFLSASADTSETVFLYVVRTGGVT